MDFRRAHSIVGLSGTFDIDLLHLPEIPFGGVSAEKLALDPTFRGVRY